MSPDVDGAPHHALCKRARPGDWRVQEEWGGTVEPRALAPEEVDVAAAALGRAPGELLYGRVDLVPDTERWAIIACEVVEPALYWRVGPGGADRLARALARRLATTR